MEDYQYIAIDPKSGWWSRDDDIKIDTVDTVILFNVPVDREELLQKAIRTLEERKKRVYAQAEKEAHAIQKKIDELLLIEYKPQPDDIVIDC